MTHIFLGPKKTAAKQSDINPDAFAQEMNTVMKENWNAPGMEFYDNIETLSCTHVMK